MFTITPIIYSELAALLVADIDSKSYYSGTVTLYTPQVDYHLTATLMLRYREVVCPDTSYCQISEIIPVWWEMSYVDDDGEQPNDFDFNILARNICQ